MLARTVEGKEKLEQIELAQLCIPEKEKKKKKAYEADNES